MLGFFTKLFRTRRRSEDGGFRTVVREMLGFEPENEELYKLALIHRSASVTLPGGGAANNERLEFLGDAVLEAIVSDFLFIEYPNETEGFLTQTRSRIVSRTSLDDIAERMGIDGHIVSNFHPSAGHRHLCGNALEAVIGAIYLDKGYEFTNRYVIDEIFGKHLDLGDITNTESDFKSRLIEWCQKSKRTIRFNTINDANSAHQQPHFVSRIVIDGIEFGCGTGYSKKEAEQQAAWVVTQIVVDDDRGDSFMDAIDSAGTVRYHIDNGQYSDSRP